MAQKEIVAGVSRLTGWWIEERLKKFSGMLHESMAVNPFLAPLLYELHFADDLSSLGGLLLSGHFMVGHATGFGKLVDEKILPEVFGTEKLSASYRAANRPLADSCFNEIDHLLPTRAGRPILLSLKMSRWTIQLTAAKGLNHAFNEILTKYDGQFSAIVVGVVYGKSEDLTDKYDILRGINRGKKHDVVDLTKHVSVYSGREFWSWINGGEDATQEWVMEGILAGIKAADCRSNAKKLVSDYVAQFEKNYSKFLRPDGSVNWNALLREING